MPSPVIEIRKLSKSYVLGAVGSWTLGHDLREVYRKLTSRDGTIPSSTSDRQFWALRDVTLDIGRGEVVGIIGRNGAGKSTLLKILSRVTAPTSGEGVVRGRVASLLEAGTGFHPDLTGRENVFLNGAFLGMKRAEIVRQLDSILDFAQIGQFIDTPVKHYSSGMYVRLGFAVAAHLQPEVLIVDEILSVGDAAFQRRCLGKMDEVATGGRTVLFVSHNHRAVQALCTRAILLEGGQIRADGRPTDVISLYEGTNSSPSASDFRLQEDTARPGQILRVRVADSEDRPRTSFTLLEPIELDMEYVLRRHFPTLVLSAQIWTASGDLALASVDSDLHNFAEPVMRDVFPREPGVYRARVRIPAPLLNQGQYQVELVLTTGPTRVDTHKVAQFEIVDNGSYLSFVSKAVRGGLLATPLAWDVQLVDRHAGSRAEEREMAMSPLVPQRF